MIIISEVEKVISKLPPHEARLLRYWLNEYQAARRYNQLKACARAAEVLADFNRNSGNALWN